MWITAENRQDWQALADSLTPTRPSVGTCVLVTHGKHKGQRGRVTWHGRNRYAETRYLSGAQLALAEAMGTIGYRVQITPTEGHPAFFVNAEYVTVDNDCL